MSLTDVSDAALGFWHATLLICSVRSQALTLCFLVELLEAKIKLGGLCLSRVAEQSSVFLAMLMGRLADRMSPDSDQSRIASQTGPVHRPSHVEAPHQDVRVREGVHPLRRSGVEFAGLCNCRALSSTCAD